MYTEPKQIYCPYCGEAIEIIIDTSVSEQQYVEDCSVCCRPIELEIIMDNDGVTVNAAREDD